MMPDLARSTMLALALLASAAPLAAQLQEVAPDKVSLERSLRTCLTTGAPGAPRDSLESAVIALRSLCEVQIRRVREFRMHELNDRLRPGDKVLTPSEREQYETERLATIRDLNNEIALAIASFTGLSS